ncbi:error-prone DNA polymerase [Leucobacter sp. UT-8R-CII-1-4]|uniref:error-prone DNA polymerase n=1 Tax=Leucobacter sp. UT-8R-CII-1-4 TaxID=3040075 RepID=UPI0024A955A2|nr:error-prone DNA polymerase [Leucobacter sp. UT-8R-CII-1-4]MDI6023080.1 error-prone DNA polymerase [Leucobacter sp. UT-8R-CII-1-4]
MGWNNPPRSWQEMERILSGRSAEGEPPDSVESASEHSAHTAGDPTLRYLAPPSELSDRNDSSDATHRTVVPYAELHAHSHYSFLDGASSPEALVAEAARLGHTGIAITDHDGFPGAPRFAEAAGDHAGLDTVYGSELSLGLQAPQLGVADPSGTHLLVLAQGVSGYHRLSAAITEAQLAGMQKGRPLYDIEALAEAANGEWVVLTGCRKGAVRQALARAENTADAERAAELELEQLTRLFGQEQVFVELTDHGHPGDDVRNAQLAELAGRSSLPTLVTGGVHAATRADTQLAEALAAIRSRRSLDELDPFLPASGGARLRSGQAMLRRFGRHKDAVLRTATLAKELSFSLRAATPKLPRLDVPAGFTQMTWLRDLVRQGAAERYGTPNAEISARLEKELQVIEQQDFPGYFLVVHDIVQFARGRGILCQGRGSAANSAICYVLGITEVDSIYYELPFERFLSSMREEEPDIDVDFDSGRREEVIQYVYQKYGRRNAAQVANVISYRPKNAVRDAAKALGFDAAAQRTFSKGLERHGKIPADGDSPVPQQVRDLANRLLDAPRHLGIHSGGMVLTERPVGEVCPIEHARMPGRTVLQWDKDDCAAMGLVKFDLLGLGMLSALQLTMDLAEEATGERWTLATLPRDEPGVYDMLCRADAIGVFQLESRAQLNTLPRLRPRRFYDLVIEIALIRPGPLQGGAIHPYLRRRNREESISYPHPLLESVLERTLGVPLFQEQLMQMAQAVGDCTAEDADLLRRAMGSKRGIARIETLEAKLFAGMKRNGIDDETARGVYAQIQAFASFGFAESHSISFALLVYASAWFKLHYPAAFLIGLLRSQPMGFYAPRTLVEDARRHGVHVVAADVQHPRVHASLESLDSLDSLRRAAGATDTASAATGLATCLPREQPHPGEFDPKHSDDSAAHRRDGNYAVRLGLAEVRGVEQPAAERIVAARADGPFLSLADLARRADLDRATIEALATAGACTGLEMTRREALWDAAPASDNRERFLPGIAVHVQPPLLPILSEAEQTALDLWSTGIVSGKHPLALLRAELDQREVTRSDMLTHVRHNSFVRVAGLVTHRQRPRTAGGVTFLTLEDESGTANIVVWSSVWQRFQHIARGSPALVVAGTLERSADGLPNIIAGAFEPLAAPDSVSSRDFR